MKWIKIDSKNLPEGEVLVANFKSGTYGYKEKVLGYLSIQNGYNLECNSESELLENPTHYIDIHSFDI